MGAKRLVDYDCKVKYKKDYMIVPREIEEPGDMRPGTKKGKLDRKPVWVVSIQMPKSLIVDIYSGYQQNLDQQDLEQQEVKSISPIDQEEQPADNLAGEGPEEGAGTEEPII